MTEQRSLVKKLAQVMTKVQYIPEERIQPDSEL